MDSYQRALEIMAATPVVLAALVAGTTNDALDRSPSPDAWSAREIVAHMLHVETAVIAPRIRKMLDEDDPVLSAAPRPPSAGDLSAMLDAWRTARAGTLGFLRALTPMQRQRAGRNARCGRINVGEHVVEWAYHDLDHLRQILAAMQAEIYGDIGTFQVPYLPPAWRHGSAVGVFSPSHATAFGRCSRSRESEEYCREAPAAKPGASFCHAGIIQGAFR